MAKDKRQSFSFDDWKNREANKPENKNLFPPQPTKNTDQVSETNGKNGNLGFLYNHLYFTDASIDFKNLSSENTEKHFKVTKNKAICEYQMDTFDFVKLGNSEIFLTTCYPGLALGLGYGHEIGAKGEFKLGFSFDFVSGLPIVPGSSVKGMLRSAFPCKKNHKKPVFITEKTAYIQTILKEDQLDIDALEKEIFEGKDVFFDAVIASKHAGNKIVGSDAITPHGLDPLRNPVPLSFLKVLPEITIVFTFELHDGLIKAKEKQKLFKQILLDFGIGAKTNVGYGQLKPA